MTCQRSVSPTSLDRGDHGQGNREELVPARRWDVCVWQLVGGCELEAFPGLVRIASGVVRVWLEVVCGVTYLRRLAGL
jgi:hypothetical protein